MNNRTALMVARLQPLHRGHTNLINRMIENHSTVIIGLGSVGKSREFHDPWNSDERKQMIKNVYGSRVKIIPLSDLNSTQGRDDWVNYVLEKISKVGLPDPTDYFSGSISDASWYRNKFLLDGDLVTNEHYTEDKNLRRLHIEDRTTNVYPAATELRDLMRLRRDDWKKWVPAVNWELVEKTYPEEFRVRL